MRRLLLLLIVLSLGLQFIQPMRAYSQTATPDTPPVIVEALPEHGEELLPGDPITLSFDQPMDAASVEKALSVSLSDAALLVQWVNTSTVNILNKGGWPARSTVKLSLDKAAKSASGLGLEVAYSGDFATIGPLRIGTVTPADKGVNVALVGTKITVSFNRPMMALADSESAESQPSPLRFAPLITGSGRWVNTSLYTWDADTLQPNTQYTVTIPRTIASADGATLDADFVWKFTTVPIQVISVQPPTNMLNTPLFQRIRITLSGPVDRPEFEKAFGLVKVNGDGQKIKGSFAWGKFAQTVEFLPYHFLELGSVYKVSVDGSVLGGRPYSYTFTTVSAPQVTLVEPYYWSDTLIVRFNTRMNIESMLTKFEITPDVGLFYPISIEQGNTIYLSKAKFKQGQTYTLRIYPGGQDIYGNAMKTLYEKTFRIPAPATPTKTPVYDQGQAVPILNSDVMLTGAYLPKTSVALRIWGKPKVDFQLYKMNAADLSDEVLANGQFSWYSESYFNGQFQNKKRENPDWVQPANLIRQWTETYDAGKTSEATILADLSADKSGNKLSSGLYWVVIKAPNYTNGFHIQSYQYALAVSTANLTVKRGAKEVFVWLTDLQTAQPVADTTVTIYNKGKPVGSGKTNAKGVFVAKTDLPPTQYGAYDEKTGEYIQYPKPLDSMITIVAESNNVFSAWFSREQRSASGKQSYLHSDRPVYRPGETVYFRGYMRDRFDVTYTIPNKKTVHIRADQRSVMYNSEKAPPLWEKDIELSPYGSFAGEFTLPDAIPGDDEVYISIDDGNKEIWDNERIILLVREFRLPEFEVKWIFPRISILQGEAANAQLRASYYAGGGVNNAKVQWRMTGIDAWFNYTGDEWYNFNADYSARSCGDYYEWYGKALDENTQTTDALGGLVIDSTKTRRETDGKLLDGVESQSCNPLTLKLEGTVTDESGQSITARGTITAHPTTAYVGIRTEQYFTQVKKALPVHLITVTPESKPVPNQKIGLEMVRRIWTRTERDGWKLTVVGESIKAEITTDADGTAKYDFVAPQEGNYLIRAVTTDVGGRINRTATEITALNEANSYAMPSWDRNDIDSEGEDENGEPTGNDVRFYSTLTLKTDKQNYQPGETAQVMIPAPYKLSVPMLITLERAGVFYYDIVQTGTSPLLYKFPVTDDAAPGATITALALSPINADYRVPQWRYATGSFSVEPSARELTVTVKAGVDRAKPGEKVPITINVKDREGKPVRAEVGLGVTDKSALSLVYPNSEPQLAHYYQDYSLSYNRVTTEVSLYALQERLTRLMAGGGGGGGGSSGPESEQPASLQIRKDYKVTPLWSPHTETDDNGQAIVYVTMPDNLTTWKIDARAVTADTRVGESTAEFITTLPLIVRPATPRFLIKGDTVELAMIVNNNTGKDQKIQAKIEAKGITLLDADTQTVTVPDTGRIRVAWRARADDSVGADLTFIAIGDGVQDAAKPSLATGPNNTIPIYRFITPDAVATAGTLRTEGARTEVIAIPQKFNGVTGELIVQADPSLAAAFPDSFTYLRNYPYQCVEQTVSRFLPNLYTLRALKALGLDKPELRQDLDQTVRDGLKLLQDSRKPNGGWSYWPEMPQADPLVSAYALLGLYEALQSGNLTDAKYLDPTISYLLSTVRTSPTVSTPSWEFNRRVFILYVLSETSERVTKQQLDEMLELRFKLSLAGRSYLLMAYHRRFPNDPAVNTLLSDLQSNAALTATGVHWSETEMDWNNWGSDTRSSALALAALVRVRPNLEILPEAVRWLMSARKGRTWQSTQESVWSLIALTDWMTATKELNGNYQLGIALNRKSLADRKVTPETVRESTSLKIAVTDLLSDRANRLTFTHGAGDGALYYTARLSLQLPADAVKSVSRGFTVQRDYLDEKGTPIHTARIGDTITVRLVFLVRDSVTYAVIADPLPAGFESANPGLRTSSSTDRAQSNFYFNRVEYGDMQTSIHASYLPAGTYTFTYKAHATTAGVFQVSPANAFAFYAPDVFGRTAGGIFTVIP